MTNLIEVEKAEGAILKEVPCFYTDRQCVVLQGQVDGLNNEQIEQKLAIRLWTLRDDHRNINERTRNFLDGRELTEKDGSRDFNRLAITIAVWYGWIKTDHLPAEPSENFTSRQKEILQLMVAGYRQNYIAGALQVSSSFIKQSQGKIRSKLELNSLQVVAWGTREIKIRGGYSCC